MCSFYKKRNFAVEFLWEFTIYYFQQKEKAPKSIDFTAAILYNNYMESGNPTKKKRGNSMGNPHSGNREILRQRFLTNGMDNMSSEDILELLLLYSTQKVNTNELAQEMIGRFGSLRGVFEANYNDLLSVKGLGKNAAVFLKLLPSVAEEYYASAYDGEKLDSINAISKFLIHHYSQSDTEALRLICFDDDMRVKYNAVIAKGDDSRVSINQKLILQQVLNSGCSKCIIAHNHPNASSEPSLADIKATKAVYAYPRKAGITLIDHFVMGDDGVRAIIGKGVVFTDDWDDWVDSL